MEWHGFQQNHKVGTACTAFGYQDCTPGAFRADGHIARIIEGKRQTMTTQSLFESIDWNHVDDTTNLHAVRNKIDEIIYALRREGLHRN